MAQLKINNHTYDIDGILFDKDGTLLDFRSLWINWADTLINDMIKLAQLPQEEDISLAQSIGYDIENKIWDPKGPLCIGSLDDLISILSHHLYNKGMPWNESIELVTTVCLETNEKNNRKNTIKPVAGLNHFLMKAREVDLKLGVVTSDNYSQAVQNLEALAILPYFHSVIGHDQVERGKPFPDMVEKSCGELGVNPSRTLIFGDSNGDMILGEKSDMVASIGIVSEPKLTVDHLENATHIIRSYDDVSLY